MPGGSSNDINRCRNENIIVLGGGYGQMLFLESIHRRLGSYVLLDVDPRAPGRRWASEFYSVSIHDFEQCRDAVQHLVTPDTAIVTFATGHAGVVCNRLCAHFGLRQRSQALVKAAVDKGHLAECVKAARLPHPQTVFIAPETRSFGTQELETLRFPAIIKPVAGGGGRDVRRFRCPQELIDQQAYWLHGEAMMVQEEIPGQEAILFAMFRRGQLRDLVHGVNVLYRGSGWFGPLGLALERAVPLRQAPAWAIEVANNLARAFELQDDYLVAEVILGEGGPFVIDVELNALSPFACSAVMDNHHLTDTLVDLYLNRSVAEGPSQPWIAGMAYIVAETKEGLRRREVVLEDFPGISVFRSGRSSRIESCGSVIYKGGYVVISGATSLRDASDRCLEFIRYSWRIA